MALRRVREAWATTTTGTPNGSHDDAVVVVREVHVHAETLQEHPAHPCNEWVARTDAWKGRNQVDDSIEVRCERIYMLAVSDPPFPFSKNMPARCGGEMNRPAFHSERSSRRTSSAETSRPASTSRSDCRSASCRRARSASSSQSPGSRGRSSSSVPSGRSVGSSITNRPARTRAFRVMNRVYPVRVGRPILHHCRAQPGTRPITASIGTPRRRARRSWR